MEQDTEQIRTPEEEFLDLAPTVEDFNSPQYDAFLSNLFNFGAIPPKSFKIADDFIVELRLLTPIEEIEIMKRVDDAPGILSKDKILTLETLARALKKINGQFLRFSDDMITEWQKFRNTSEVPTAIEQQRYILQYRFQPAILTILYQKYQELMKLQEQALENLKKK